MSFVSSAVSFRFRAKGMMVPAVAGLLMVMGCNSKPKTEAPASPAVAEQKAVAPAFQVDPATAGIISGKIKYTGPKPAHKAVDMTEDPACLSEHPPKEYAETPMVGAGGGVGNSFVYIKAGLEGKSFAVPAEPVTIDQKGCWFHPHVLGIQVGQTLKVINSDPVTHNIHPQAKENREWNHSQGPGEPPIDRTFTKQEVMIPVKCNIHNWMHTWIGVLPHPYYAVTAADGTFEIKNLPPGTYTVGIWEESLGAREQQVTVAPSGKADVSVTFGKKS